MNDNQATFCVRRYENSNPAQWVILNKSTGDYLTKDGLIISTLSKSAAKEFCRKLNRTAKEGRQYADEYVTEQIKAFQPTLGEMLKKGASPEKVQAAFKRFCEEYQREHPIPNYYPPN